MKFFSSFFIALLSLQPALAARQTTFPASGLLKIEQVIFSRNTSIARGAKRVTLLTLKLSATCSAPVSVRSISVKHVGAGSREDILRLYAVLGGHRVSSFAQLNRRDGIADIRLWNFSVGECAAGTIDIVADFSSNAAIGGQHALVFVQGNFDAPRVEVSVPQTPVTTQTTPLPAGSVTATLLDLPLQLSYGAGRTVARVQLDSSSDRDQYVTAITFTNEGSARGGDLQNLHLTTNAGVRLSDTVKTLNGDHVRVVLNPPFHLSANDRKLILLKGDVRASRRKTVELVIEEQSDIESSVSRQ
jgi:hypothetical protein